MSKIGDLVKRVKRSYLEKKAEELKIQVIAYGKEIKEEVFRQIREHAVSKELSETPHPASKFLSGRETSTLFGYLGFVAGTKPVEELIRFLDRFWKLEPKVEKSLLGLGRVVHINFPRPRKEQLVSAGLVLPWQQSIAWPYFIEQPISNLPYFLNKHGFGLSNEGIQVKYLTKDASFDGVPYLSSIFENTSAIRRKKKFNV